MGRRNQRRKRVRRRQKRRERAREQALRTSYQEMEDVVKVIELCGDIDRAIDAATRPPRERR